LPVGAGEEAEGDDEAEEDNDEDDVGAECADQKDEAEETHEYEEEGIRRGEANGSHAFCFAPSGWGIGPVGVIEGLEGCGEGEPETAEGHKDDKWEGVAEDEFEKTADDHEKTAKEVVGSAAHVLIEMLKDCHKAYIEAAPLPPDPRQPIRSQDRGVRERRKPSRALYVLSAWRFDSAMVDLHGCWVTKGLSEITLDSSLWREIDLLEEFG
jgi:hypothetical protein